MNKIKVIDLLNMISKGEEVPNKIKIKQWEYNEEDEDLEYELFDRLYNEDFELNDEVEEIEEDKKIEKIPNTYLDKEMYSKYWDIDTKILQEKINEIIDKINEE